MERQNMMKIFPGLEEYWDKDDGHTFLREYFNISNTQRELELLTKQLRKHRRNSRVVALTVFQVETLLLRLHRDEDDNRSFFTEGQMAELEYLDDLTMGGPVYYKKRKYLKLMKLIQSHKVTDEWNIERMGTRLRYAFEFQELGAEYEE